jgi:hypothetical protein
MPIDDALGEIPKGKPVTEKQNIEQEFKPAYCYYIEKGILKEYTDNKFTKYHKENSLSLNNEYIAKGKFVSAEEMLAPAIENGANLIYVIQCNENNMEDIWRAGAKDLVYEEGEIFWIIRYYKPK